MPPSEVAYRARLLARPNSKRAAIPHPATSTHSDLHMCSHLPPGRMGIHILRRSEGGGWVVTERSPIPRPRNWPILSRAATLRGSRSQRGPLRTSSAINFSDADGLALLDPPRRSTSDEWHGKRVSTDAKCGAPLSRSPTSHRSTKQLSRKPSGTLHRHIHLCMEPCSDVRLSAILLLFTATDTRLTESSPWRSPPRSALTSVDRSRACEPLQNLLFFILHQE